MSPSPRLATAPAAPITVSEHDTLPPGTRFGEFEVVRVIGVGGFGIVYLARDHSLERDVALKEYMPASLATRGVGPQITIRSASFAETYAMGLRSFVNEARLLARFDHPSLVKVYRFWEDNATAYMVMPYLQGRTLRETRRAIGRAPDEAWIRSVIATILSALELLHREGVYHRDIAPDNIFLPENGPAMLLDFGAARRVIGDRTQSLTAILKPSYAPIEQYAEMAQLRQGPWTDFYALGAVVHYLLFGAPPTPATARAVQDDAEPIDSKGVAGISPRLISIVAWMLAVRPAERPQSVAELRAALDGDAVIAPHGGRAVTLPPLVSRPAAAAANTANGDAPFAPTMRMPRPAIAAAARPAGSTPRVRPGWGWRAWPVRAACGGIAVALIVAIAVLAGQAKTRRLDGAAATSVAAAQTAAAAGAKAPVVAPVAAPPPLAPPAAVVPQVAMPPVPPAAVVPQVATPTVPPAGPSSNQVGSLTIGAPAGDDSGAGRPMRTRPAPRVAGQADNAVARSAAAAVRSSDAKTERAGAVSVVNPSRPPRPVATAGVPVVARAPAPLVAAREPTTLGEACGQRGLMTMAACIAERCDEVRFRDTPECIGVLARRASRENR